MREAAGQLSMLELDDLPASSDDDFAELLEAFDLMRAQRSKWPHCQILPDPDRAVGSNIDPAGADIVTAARRWRIGKRLGDAPQSVVI
jgi:hypothetical protein